MLLEFYLRNVEALPDHTGQNFFLHNVLTVSFEKPERFIGTNPCLWKQPAGGEFRCMFCIVDCEWSAFQCQFHNRIAQCVIIQIDIFMKDCFSEGRDFS